MRVCTFAVKSNCENFSHLLSRTLELILMQFSSKRLCCVRACIRATNPKNIGMRYDDHENDDDDTCAHVCTAAYS